MEIETYGYRWSDANTHMIHFDSDNDKNERPQRTAFEADRQHSSLPSSLEQLPLEIIHRVLRFLSPADLFQVSLVSFAGYGFVHSLPAFRDLTLHALPALKALSSTQLSHEFTISQLYCALRTEACYFCGLYGPYLYLLRCVRCCYFCTTTEKRAISLPLRKAQTLVRKAGFEMKTPTKLLTLPGEYGYAERRYTRRRQWLVSWGAVLELLNSPPELTRTDQRLHRFDSRRLTEDEQDAQRRFKFHASVVFPSLSRTGNATVTEHGIWCRGCEDSWQLSVSNRDKEGNESLDLHADQHIAYSREGFRQHCYTCPGVARLHALGYPNFTVVPKHRRFAEMQ